MLHAVLIGGGNGAGKTTFARDYVPTRHPDAVFLNADEIQREGRAHASPVAAGRELLRRLDHAFDARQSFVVETTLSSGRYARRAVTWRHAGYRFVVHFIEAKSADFCVARVAQRARYGGHDVPDRDIHRRFERGIRLFREDYKPAADTWYHWFADEEGLRLVDRS